MGMNYKEFMTSNSLGYEFLGPTQPLGILILIIGAIFTGIIFVVFINASQDQDSSVDRRRKELAKEEQSKKIARLYPQIKKK